MIEAEGIRRQQDIAWANEYQQRELDFRREIMERQQEEHDRRLLISNLPETAEAHRYSETDQMGKGDSSGLRHSVSGFSPSDGENHCKMVDRS